MRKWTGMMVVVGLAAFGVAACDDAGTEPEMIDMEAVRAEAALVAADGMFQDLSLVQDPGLRAFGFGGMGAGAALAQGMGGQCQQVGASGTFQCGNMSRDGFTFTREVTFFDADGKEQEGGYDEATTDAIHLVVQAEGSRERSFWTATMSRSRDMWMTELLTDAHHLDGEGASEVYRSGNPQEGGERTFDMTVGAAWNDVVHLQPREEHPYPESGTVTRNIFVQVSLNGEIIGGREVETVITFNGTRFVTMTVDGEEFQIDLAEREVRQRWGRNQGQG